MKTYYRYTAFVGEDGTPLVRIEQVRKDGTVIREMHKPSAFTESVGTGKTTFHPVYLEAQAKRPEPLVLGILLICVGLGLVVRKPRQA